MASTIKTDLKALERQLAEFASVLKVKESDLSPMRLAAVFQRRMRGDWKDQSRCIGISSLMAILEELQKYRDFSPEALMQRLQKQREIFERCWAEDAEVKEDDPVIRRRKRYWAQRRRLKAVA
jgi:hypothetical protein